MTILAWQRGSDYLTTHSGRRQLIISFFYHVRFILLPLARFYRRTLIRRVKIIAVVGSFGKTTTTRAIAAALRVPDHRQWGNNGSLLAAMLLLTPPWRQYRVLEVAISKKGHMARNAGMVCPDIVVVTGIGSEHGTTLGDLTQTREEKAEMIKALSKTGMAVLNGDDVHVLKMRDGIDAKIVTCGYGEHNDLQAEYLGTTLDAGTRFSIKIDDIRHDVCSRLLGRAIPRSYMAAVAVAREAGVEARTVFDRLGELSPAPERLNLTYGPEGAAVLVDSYKAAIETVELALQTMEDIPATRKIVILGEVEEPPGSVGPLYRNLGARIAGFSDHLYFIGKSSVKSPLFQGAKNAGMSKECLHYLGHDIQKAMDIASKMTKPGDLILIKGRFSQKLGRIALAIKGEPSASLLEFCPQKMSCPACHQLSRFKTH